MKDPIDWTDAFENGAYIPGASAIRQGWETRAQAFRDTTPGQLDQRYGPHSRNRFDLFDAQDPQGTLIFIHGGYWHQTDKSLWSHLAAGSVARGWSVALPSYPLAPEVSIPEITTAITQAVRTILGQTKGPIAIAGHSAGGHLAARMACTDIDIPRDRIGRITSISGLHDLRPFRHAKMNDILGLSEDDARAESPALLQPAPGAQITAFVGASERPEFLRQTRLLGEAWGGQTQLTELYDPETNHFTVIDGLCAPDSALTNAVLGPV